MYRLEVSKKKNLLPDKEELVEKNVIVIDGVEYDDRIPITRNASAVIYDIEGSFRNRYIIKVHDKEIFSRMSDIPFCEISKSVILFRSLAEYDYELIHQRFRYNHIKESISVDDILEFDTATWSGPWSIADFVEEFSLLFEGSSITQDYETRGVFRQAYIQIQFTVVDEQSTLAIESGKIRPEIDRLIEATKNSLRSKMNESSFVHYFQFPEGLQGACEEYLWSFVQFLKEVGVDATAELKQDRVHAGQVLFSVTPTRGKAVLGKVKQALDLYIHLAGTSNFEFDPNAPIASDIIQARISSFQSQLSLATANAKMQLAENRANEATIRAQETTIQSQQLMLNTVSANNVFLLSRVESLEGEARRKSQDEIRLLKDIVRIGNMNFSKVGVSINLPRLLAALKRAMQDDSIPAIVLQDLGLPALPPYEVDKE